MNPETFSFKITSLSMRTILMLSCRYHESGWGNLASSASLGMGFGMRCKGYLEYALYNSLPKDKLS